MKKMLMSAALLAGAVSATGLHAQTVVKHIQDDKSFLASAVWAGDTLYLSGQMASPITPADPAKKVEADYGNTEQQAMSILTKIQALLKAQGLDMKDVVKATVFLAGDPKLDGKIDFNGFNTAFKKFFGTAEQPNKPARSAVQVYHLVAPWALAEVEVIAVKSK